MLILNIIIFLFVFVMKLKKTSMSKTKKERKKRVCPNIAYISGITSIYIYIRNSQSGQHSSVEEVIGLLACRSFGPGKSPGHLSAEMRPRHNEIVFCLERH